MVGLVDGTQIPIAAPYEYPENYVNRHGYFSIATQITCNHRGAITHISCKWPGSTNDKRVLQMSSLQPILDRYILRDKYLLADAGYTCQANLITPHGLVDSEEKA